MNFTAVFIALLFTLKIQKLLKNLCTIDNFLSYRVKSMVKLSCQVTSITLFGKTLPNNHPQK